MLIDITISFFRLHQNDTIRQTSWKNSYPPSRRESLKWFGLVIRANNLSTTILRFTIWSNKKKMDTGGEGVNGPTTSLSGLEDHIYGPRHLNGNGQLLSCAVTLHPHSIVGLIIMNMMTTTMMIKYMYVCIYNKIYPHFND